MSVKKKKIMTQLVYQEQFGSGSGIFKTHRQIRLRLHAALSMN